MNRGNHEVDTLVHACKANSVTDLVIVHETRGQPGTVTKILLLCDDICLRSERPSVFLFPQTVSSCVTCLSDRRRISPCTTWWWDTTSRTSAPCPKPSPTSFFTTSPLASAEGWVTQEDDVNRKINKNNQFLCASNETVWHAWYFFFPFYNTGYIIRHTSWTF